jgi:hypothetical protein
MSAPAPWPTSRPSKTKPTAYAEKRRRERGEKNARTWSVSTDRRESYANWPNSSPVRRCWRPATDNTTVENGENRVSEISSQAETSPVRRRELIDELKGHMIRVQEGDEEAIADMEASLEQIPSIARKFGNLNLLVEQGFIERSSGNNPVKQKSLTITLRQMREELAGPNPSPLEVLGAERVTSCWLQLHYAELLYNQELPKLTLSEDDYHQKRLDRLHKRYLSAMRSLAQVRKLLKPKVAQINIGEKQQINTGSAALEPVRPSTA